jgi:hypothetical protein
VATARDQFATAFLQADGFAKTKALLRHADHSIPAASLHAGLRISRSP